MCIRDRLHVATSIVAEAAAAAAGGGGRKPTHACGVRGVGAMHLDFHGLVTRVELCISPTKLCIEKKCKLNPVNNDGLLLTTGN